MGDALVTIDRDAAATGPRHHRAAGSDAAALLLRRRAMSLTLLLAVVFGVFSVAVVARLSAEPVTYASFSTSIAIVDLLAGLGPIAAGGVLWLNQRRGSTGVLAALIGVTWLAADWIAWTDGSSLVRSIAMVAAPFLLPLVCHLGVAGPNGRITGRRARAIVVVAYSIMAVVSIGWALFRDPFLDRYCWSNCRVNMFLVHADPTLSRLLTDLWQRFLLAAGIVLAVMCAWRLARSSRVARTSLLPVLGPVVVVALSQSLYAGLLLADPGENPERHVFQIIFVIRAAALVTLALGILLTVLHELRTKRSVARLADELSEASLPGALGRALGRSLGDEQLNVAYWLPGSQVYVDATGQRVDPRPGPTQAMTPIERNGQSIAIVTHDRALLARHDLEREIGAASRLVVDNERLRAQALAQLADLKASRTRIVEAADSARRQIERNLHDGAQQRLLALSYELRLAEADARAAHDTAIAQVLAIAIDNVTTVLVELRELAHGIFPVILAEAGLGPALATYVDTAPIRVELVDLSDERFTDDVEIAMYITVTAVVEAAVRRSASHVVVTFTQVDGELGVRLLDDGVGGKPDDLIHVRDRVGALGGSVDVCGSVVQSVIPCA